MRVEIFKTNISKVKLAKEVRAKLLSHFPDSKINFDLQDCDKILRVEGEQIQTEKVIKVLIESGYACEVLE